MQASELLVSIISFLEHYLLSIHHLSPTTIQNVLFNGCFVQLPGGAYSAYCNKWDMRWRWRKHLFSICQTNCFAAFCLWQRYHHVKLLPSRSIQYFRYCKWIDVYAMWHSISSPGHMLSWTSGHRRTNMQCLSPTIQSTSSSRVPRFIWLRFHLIGNHYILIVQQCCAWMWTSILIWKTLCTCWTDVNEASYAPFTA